MVGYSKSWCVTAREDWIPQSGDLLTIIIRNDLVMVHPQIGSFEDGFSVSARTRQQCDRMNKGDYDLEMMVMMMTSDYDDTRKLVIASRPWDDPPTNHVAWHEKALKKSQG